MKKVYKNQNGIIYVELPETSNREELLKVTEDFLKKVINGGSRHEYTNTCKNFREE